MKRSLLAITAAAALMLSGCATGTTDEPAAGDGEPIPIGAVIPLTGAFAGFGP